MKMGHPLFLDSVSFLPCALRKLPEAFGLEATKLWYPPYFNTDVNLDYVGSMRGILWCGQDERRGEVGIPRVVQEAVV